MKISVLTLGCKVNQAESTNIEGILRSDSHNLVDLAGKPDICIINTCAVTAKSDYQSRQLIRRAQRAGARVIVTGCYSQLNKQAVSSMSGVSDVVDNNNKIETIKALIGSNTSLCIPIQTLPMTRSRYFLKVQDGCNYSCSYCTIPSARGRSVSVLPDAVLEEACRVVSAGYNEIVLTGIHLGTYGLDLEPKVKLSVLITTLLNKTKIGRIRLSSLEIREAGDDIIDLFEDKRICNHLHLPLQSGDDKILKKMHRTYNLSQFFRVVERIHKKMPNLALGTDIIVGFPGETEIEYNNTYNTLNSLPFSYFHIFPFSSRAGTKASKMTDQVPIPEIKARAKKLTALNNQKKEAFQFMQKGRTLDVLIEQTCEDGTAIGTSGNYQRVKLLQNKTSRGSIVNATISGIERGVLYGTMV